MKRSLVRSGFTEMKYDTGRVLINYAKGPPGDTPIFLIPGQNLPWESYTRVLQGLSEHFEVYAVDVHGHGRYGLVGALDDNDVDRVRSLVGSFRYRKIETGHVMHLHRPADFIARMLEMKE